MVLFIAAIVFLLAAVAALFGRKWVSKSLAELIAQKEANPRQSRESELADKQATKTFLTVLGGFTSLLFILLLAWSCVKIVPANNVGIPVAFGQIGSPLDSGFHIEKPWTKVHNFSTRLQESSMLSSGEGEQGKQDSISVRGNDGYEMWVDVTIRYTIDEAIADQLFRRVGSMDGIRDRIVRPEVRESETRKQVAERDATALTTKAQGEADAKRIAAQGEADSNKKVSESLTPEILRQLQIEALKNGTVYVVPDGGNFVLGNLGK